jgi:transcriptional regulator CtsR
MPLFFIIIQKDFFCKTLANIHDNGYNIIEGQEKSKIKSLFVKREVPMANLADLIEEFIKMSFEQVPGGILEIQRNEMANKFKCAPSQINYVLTTRFTIDKGYMVESRRGGGGYIRIKKLRLKEDEFLKRVIQYIGDSISSHQSDMLIRGIWEQDIITDREVAILNAAINPYTLNITLPERDSMRARILKGMITAIMDFNARRGGK